MKKIIVAAGLTVALISNAQAQTMTMSKVLNLASMVGMGVGIGEVCRISSEPLKNSFERMRAAERFSEQQRTAMSKAFDGGGNMARSQTMDVQACLNARRIWATQVETLTLSMAAARKR